MFEVRTCPICDDLLAPGLVRCAACAAPDPEAADPWRSGTAEAIAAPTALAVRPEPGSLLATGPTSGSRRKASRFPTIFAGVVVAATLVLLLLGVSPVVDVLDLPGLPWLPGGSAP